MVLLLNFTGLLSGDERLGKSYLYAMKEAYVRGCKGFCVNGICYSLGILSSN